MPRANRYFLPGGSEVHKRGEAKIRAKAMYRKQNGPGEWELTFISVNA
jgi:hypothetical protein